MWWRAWALERLEASDGEDPLLDAWDALAGGSPPSRAARALARDGPDPGPDAEPTPDAAPGPDDGVDLIAEPRAAGNTAGHTPMVRAMRGARIAKFASSLTASRRRPAVRPWPADDDQGVTQIIGTLLLTLVTVTMAVGLTSIIDQAQPTVADRVAVDLGFALDPGTGGWGTGDEAVLVKHRGGEKLPAATTRISVQIGSTTTVLEDGALGGAFSDGSFVIGDTWTHSQTIPADTPVSIDVATTAGQPHVIAIGSLRSGDQECSTDTVGPLVDGATRTPNDVTTGLTSDVDILLTVVDGCAGVDATVAPELWYRLNDGSDPTYTSAGVMTLLTGTTWTGTIPAPGSDWSAHEDDTLEYYASDMTDLVGNTATSKVYSDLVQLGDDLSATLNYVTSRHVFSGTVTDFAAAQSATDSGAEANLTEADASGGTSQPEIHATAHTNSGATSAADATGAPDDAHATLPGDNDWVAVTGFNTFSGAISKVELAFEGHYDGTPDTGSGEDTLTVSYEVSGQAGATDRVLLASELNATADGPPIYVDVTADRSWTWTDIGNMEIRATYDKALSEDPLDFLIDALWLRVTSNTPDYNLSVRMSVAGLPAASTHVVELAYRTTSETMNVDLWNFTSSSWDRRGDPLTASTSTTWTNTTTTHHVSGNQVRLRFVDSGNDSGPQDSLFLDYVRVRSS